MRQFQYEETISVYVLLLYSILFYFILTEAHSSPKDPEECRIQATIAQDTNVIYDFDLTPHNEALVVGPEYYNLSQEQKEEVVKAYNCMMVRKNPNQNLGCFNFYLKDYKTNQRIGSYINCRLISE